MASTSPQPQIPLEVGANNIIYNISGNVWARTWRARSARSAFGAEKYRHGRVSRERNDRKCATRRHKIFLETDLVENLPHFIADQIQLRLVFRNLVVNAVCFDPKKITDDQSKTKRSRIRGSSSGRLWPWIISLILFLRQNPRVWVWD
jgi:hypothetical protein